MATQLRGFLQRWLITTVSVVVATLGLFTLVINAVLLYLVGQMKFFHVRSFGAAFWGALVISLVSLLLNSFTRTGDARIEVHRGKPRPPADKSDDGGGPVIDI